MMTMEDGFVLKICAFACLLIARRAVVLQGGLGWIVVEGGDEYDHTHGYGRAGATEKENAACYDM